MSTTGSHDILCSPGPTYAVSPHPRPVGQLPVPASAGTLDTRTPLFVGMVVGGVFLAKRERGEAE